MIKKYAPYISPYSFDSLSPYSSPIHPRSEVGGGMNSTDPTKKIRPETKNKIDSKNSLRSSLLFSTKSRGSDGKIPVHGLYFPSRIALALACRVVAWAAHGTRCCCRNWSHCRWRSRSNEETSQSV